MGKMGFFNPKQAIIKKVMDTFVNPKLDGIGTIDEISYKNKELFIKLSLADFEDRPLEIRCTDIKLAANGSFVSIGNFECNKKFADTALNRFLANKEITIPEGAARMAAIAAKTLLGL